MGNLPASSHSSQWGLISFCTKSRTVFLRASCSAVNFTLSFSCCLFGSCLRSIDARFRTYAYERVARSDQGRSKAGHAKCVGPQPTNVGFAAHVQNQSQYASCIPWVNQTVVPEPCCTEQRSGAVFQLLGGGLLQKIQGFRIRLYATATLLVLSHNTHHLASLSGAHDGCAAVGPGEDESRVKSAAAHGVVTCTIGTADHDCDFWYPTVGNGLNHF